MSEIFENPALNPTREWLDTPEVRIELQLLVKGTPSDRVDLLRRLVRGTICDMTAKDRELAEFFNAVSTAFGFVPMIQIEDDCCRLVPGAHIMLSEMLAT
jgi:hypothetical protein